jgi:hypothetical protein
LGRSSPAKPRVEANPELEFANAFGVIFQFEPVPAAEVNDGFQD